jgi:hypothetical protein
MIQKVSEARADGRTGSTEPPDRPKSPSNNLTQTFPIQLCQRTHCRTQHSEQHSNNLNHSAVPTTAITAFPTLIRTREDSRSSAPDGPQHSHHGTNHYPNHTSKTQIPKPEILGVLFLPFDDSIRRGIEDNDAPRDMLDEVVTQIKKFSAIR